MKQFRTTIIALIVLVVVIIGFAVVMFLTGGEEEDTTPVVDEVYESLIPDFSTSKVIGIESKGEETIILKKDAMDDWIVVSPTDIELYDGAVSDILSKVRNISGEVILEDVTDADRLAEYGINDDEYMLFKYKDGSEIKVLFGDYDLTGSNYRFLMIEGSGKIMKVPAATMLDSDPSLPVDRASLVNKHIFKFSDSAKVRYIEVLKKGKQDMVLSADFTGETITWNMSYPLEIAGDAGEISGLVSLYTSLSVYEDIESNCQDLAKYGLDNPAYTVTVKDHKKTETLNIGNLSGDGLFYYITIGDVNNVYTVLATSVTFIDENVIKYLEPHLFQEDQSVLSSIDIEIQGQKYHLDYDVSLPGAEEVYSNYKFNGVDVVGKDLQSTFKKITTSVYLVDLDGIEVEAPAKGELVCSILYTRTDGSTVFVECYKRDGATCSLYKDGEYFGGYCYMSVILGEEDGYGIINRLRIMEQELGIS